MNRIGIIGNSTRPAVRQLMPELTQYLASQSAQLVLSNDLSKCIGKEVLQGYELTIVENDDFIGENVDWVIAIGGDGTLLKAARLVGSSEIPILGVNSGKLGFMMPITPDMLTEAIKRVFNNDYVLDSRQILQGHIEGEVSDSNSRQLFALNDIVIDKGSICRAIELGIFINDQYVNTVLADGLIISTPTGSTAYSLAAGGPIVVPDMEAIIVSPICPHTLSNRSMVLAATDVIRVEVLAGHPNLLVTIDGQEDVAIQPGNSIKFCQASHFVKLIRFKEFSFYDVLRTKLKWGER
tara:strand:- start:45564 stop:46448 length:885 start_codon:yes stop_codon:yes gene_type:complete